MHHNSERALLVYQRRPSSARRDGGHVISSLNGLEGQKPEETLDTAEEDVWGGGGHINLCAKCQWILHQTKRIKLNCDQCVICLLGAVMLDVVLFVLCFLFVFSVPLLVLCLPFDFKHYWVIWSGRSRRCVWPRCLSSPTDTQCKTTAKADIILLVDGSWSIGRVNFKTIRNFIGRMVGVFDIGPDKVQIGEALPTPHLLWPNVLQQTPVF